MNAKTDPATLTKAVLRAAERLGLVEALPRILDIDEFTMTRLSGGEALLDPDKAEWIAATRFASLFRSLILLLGDANEARTWLGQSHQTLGAPPAELLQTAEGRERVLSYLDAVQKFEIKLPPRSGPH